MFEKIETDNAYEAANILIKQAAPTIRCISEKDVREEFKDMKECWASRELFSGKSKKMEKLILMNIEELSKVPGFERFVIKVLEDEKCAQLMALFKTSFTGVRLWRTDDKLFVCGNAAFHGLAETESDLHAFEKQALLKYWKACAQELWKAGQIVKNPVCDVCNCSLSRSDCYYFVIGSRIKCAKCTNESLKNWEEASYSPAYFGQGELENAIRFNSSSDKWILVPNIPLNVEKQPTYLHNIKKKKQWWKFWQK